jgi:hypothetical protein
MALTRFETKLRFIGCNAITLQRLVKCLANISGLLLQFNLHYNVDIILKAATPSTLLPVCLL